MARQDEIFAQTISGMKRAMLRKGDDSESDESVEKPTNRGNKLKRKAKYVEEGRLDLANSVRAYRKKINYNGFVRGVISKNPVRVDSDGDVVDHDGEDSAEDIEDFVEDPYGEVKIENLLMPLTSAAELKTHPSLSIPYNSKVLDEMIQNAQDLLFREEEALWRIKKLTSEFRGDSNWMPCGNFESETDLALLRGGIPDMSIAPSVADGDTAPFQDANWDGVSSVQVLPNLEEAVEPGIDAPDMSGVSVVDMDATAQNTHEVTNAIPNPLKRMDEARDAPSQDESQNDVVMGEGTDQRPEEIALNGTESHVNGSSEAQSPKQGDDSSKIPTPQRVAGTNADIHSEDPSEIPVHQVNGETDHGQNEDENAEDTGDDETSHPPHRMTTRAKAQAATSPESDNPGSPSNALQYIHPFFIPPASALSTKECGLPFGEADDTRRLVCAYAQKQEEVCRGASRLYLGLLRARRMRDEVLEWCQAEGHVGEMSDGEDWYDREKWNLTEDLKKGEELDEEEANATGKKATRGRRTARDA